MNPFQQKNNIAHEIFPQEEKYKLNSTQSHLENFTEMKHEMNYET